ncbi:GNAT family N-acetyltransferase [Rummeliibacillus sp. JY-2-4R]
MSQIMTERIKLEEVSEKDIDGIFTLYSDTEIMRYFGRTPISNKQEALEIILQNISMKDEGLGVRYSAYLKDTDVFVGIITLKRYDARNRRVEIDYIVAKEHQRKGLASEMLKLFLEDVFKKWRLERISAFVFLENEPSCKLLEKFNFNKEGILIHWTCVDDVFYDSYSYSLILSDFEKYHNY